MRELLSDARKSLKGMEPTTNHAQETANMKRYGLSPVVRAPLTMRVESTSLATPTVGRLVVRFNREPSKQEAKEKISAAFGGHADPIAGSYRKTESGPTGLMAFGFVRKNNVSLPADHARSMEQVAKNVYMDKTDQTIWQVDGDRIVKTATDDLQEIMSYPDMAPANPYKPETASVHVASLRDQPHMDTRYVCYVDPETARVSFGAQVSEDCVFSRKGRQLVDIAQDLVVDTTHLRGMDRIFDYEKREDAVDLAKAGESEYAEYYSHVYGFHKPYLKKVEKTMAAKALL